MSDGGSHWVYDVNLIATEDLSGNFKGTWTQTLLKVTGPVSTMEGADKYWKIGVPDQSNVTGSRSGSSVKLDFGGRLLPLKYLGDNLSGAKNYLKEFAKNQYIDLVKDQADAEDKKLREIQKELYNLDLYHRFKTEIA